ncbi:MAG: type VI secretion system contractile sheath large subunit [Gammaproteobacteria bacterium]|nr:type VI secretion system contractile sheath large subunit [Gammaproteobacteria bacterium]MDH5777093.1 type VI secretion system contractile sheath large subunit [Gammaproteobacteria bacterium]
MSTSSSQTLPSKLGSATPVVDLDSLYTQPAYITDLTGFLEEKDDYKALVHWLTEYEVSSQLKTTNDITLAIHRTIATLDEHINEQLNEIIHHEKFQKLEASWRGLWYLAVQAEGATNIKIKVLDASWTDVVKDISRALEFDQSHLFHKVYSEEYGTPGGEPYGVLIGDYEISHRISKKHPHDDISVLAGLAQIAAAAFSPFVAAASSELFGLDDFAGLGLPLNLDSIFTQTEYIKWRSLRDQIDSRFVGLTVPRILMRCPYRKTPGSYKGIHFHETHKDETHSGYLWGNAAYGFAGILIREFANVGWFGHIRGVPRNHVSGGVLTTLPVDVFETDSSDIAYKPVTEVMITDTVERELSDLGFMPLCQCYDLPFAAFYNNQSIQKPKKMDNRDATANAKLSAMLQHVLCGSRIAHYIKVIIRDKVGSFITAEECEGYLREWLFKYTTGREDLEWEEQARYPLREANVKVREHPSKPGQYLCVIHMRPHYQLDQMVSELELITELAQANK